MKVNSNELESDLFWYCASEKNDFSSSLLFIPSKFDEQWKESKCHNLPDYLFNEFDLKYSTHFHHFQAIPNAHVQKIIVESSLVEL